MLDKQYIESALSSSDAFLSSIDLDIKKGVQNRTKQKKFNEIIGFCEHLFKVIGNRCKKEELVFLECSCGKSYLSFAVNFLLKNAHTNYEGFFIGVDTNRNIIDKCNRIKSLLGYDNMEFAESSTISYTPDRKIDVVIALHACDTATDEAIVKGITTGAKYIIVVPCCQNQIRSQLKSGHSLTALTDFGVLRYRFADLLTDALRSQFLRCNGYSVELKEITTMRTTPKNLIIIARKKKKAVKKGFDVYNNLNNEFNIQSKLLELLPEHLNKN
ncbi:MAG: class I SAM-dependent methyltransferase [Candidatus Anammoxibacter sp.]